MKVTTNANGFKTIVASESDTGIKCPTCGQGTITSGIGADYFDGEWNCMHTAYIVKPHCTASDCSFETEYIESYRD